MGTQQTDPIPQLLPWRGRREATGVNLASVSHTEGVCRPPAPGRRSPESVAGVCF